MDAVTPSTVRSFARFAVLSGGGWVVDTALLLALVALAGVPVAPANLASAATAATLVYLIAHRHIHAGTEGGVVPRVGVYLAYTAVLILLASWAMAPLSVVAGRAIDADPTSPVAAFAAKCLVTPPLLLSNFLVSRALAGARAGRGDG